MHWHWDRRPKTHVRPALVEMDYPWFENELQMALIQRNKEIQALPPQRPADSFTYGVCLWRPHWRSQYSHTHGGHSLVQFSRKDAVMVVDDKSIRMIAGERLTELLQRPFCGPMRRHVEMENLPAAQFNAYEYIKDTECGS
jgi:hypothetical protein